MVGVPIISSCISTSRPTFNSFFFSLLIKNPMNSISPYNHLMVVLFAPISFISCPLMVMLLTWTNGSGMPAPHSSTPFVSMSNTLGLMNTLSTLYITCFGSGVKSSCPQYDDNFFVFHFPQPTPQALSCPEHKNNNPLSDSLVRILHGLRNEPV